MWDEIHKFIAEIEPLFLVIIPAFFVTYMKIRDKIKEKKKELEKENEAKNKEKFLEWEHTESMLIVDKIKTICNYYRDIGHMDLVNYVQLENGTVATSKLYNMFLSCLAEDNRFGDIPKMLYNFQRIPYSRLSTWVNYVLTAPHEIYRVNTRDDFPEDYLNFTKENNEQVKSFISGAVKDPNGVLIGICSFYFTNENCCGKDEESLERCQSIFNNFITSIETVFLSYHTARREKKKELNLK